MRNDIALAALIFMILTKADTKPLKNIYSMTSEYN